MDGLARLHVLDAETYEGIVIGRVPQIVDPDADLQFAVRPIGKRVMGIDDNEVITNVYRASVAYLPVGNPKSIAAWCAKTAFPIFFGRH